MKEKLPTVKIDDGIQPIHQAAKFHVDTFRKGSRIDNLDEYLEKIEYYMNNHADIGDLVPTKAGLSVFIGVPYTTLHFWSERYPDFKLVWEAIEVHQQVRLVNGGLSGAFNPKVASMMLGRHGYGRDDDKGVQININIDRSCGGVVVDGEPIDTPSSD